MIIAIYLTFINLYAFFVYGLDKHKAVKNGEKESGRVPSVSVRGKSGSGRRGRSGSRSGEGDHRSSGVRPGGRSHTGRSAVRRVPEATLIMLAVIGGGIGAFLGMLAFRHKTQKKKFTRAVPAMAVLWGAFIVFCLYQNFHLTVTYYRYESDADCRIVQISDLHNQFFGFGESVLLSKIEKLDPDVIVVTGDAVDASRTNYRRTEAFFEGAVKIAPVYYVTGNHEVGLAERDEENDTSGYKEYLETVQGYGVVFLDGKTVGFGEDIILAGAADNSQVPDCGWEGDPRLKVLLSHDPGNLKAYAGSGADLVFAGHLHGGQIIIPGKGGLLSPDLKFFPEIYNGIHDLGDYTMVVSRGLGNSALPLRINNCPEIVVVDV